MRLALLFLISFALVINTVLCHNAHQNWRTAYATFYGDDSGGETRSGACGYEDVFAQGYGLYTAALSTALFNNGATCGACYKLRCYNNPQWCNPNAIIKITATNLCPPNYNLPNDNGGWCNPPREHFDLSLPMFRRLVKDYHVGIIPVQYRRVKCSSKKGGIRFEMKGGKNWMEVLVFNVGGGGDVTEVRVKGSTSEWLNMGRVWGQNWNVAADLTGQSLSFTVKVGNGRQMVSPDVAPVDWQFGRTYEGRQFQ